MTRQRYVRTMACTTIGWHRRRADPDLTMPMSPGESALETENARSDLDRPDRLDQTGNAELSGTFGATVSNGNPSQSVRQRRPIVRRCGRARPFGGA
ncbi:hypothetical protein SAMN05421783_12272 [Thiocapsa roseopersicina]|uniref:Uncharacterized protein n=1 Tax=Thiocapsa roseopersicina TaxID=1058 RepID=A0A1H3B3Z0_THIRO|nr:hypothetical protein SAMN05421783_12272 [Thiocapsa roseopersicina]